MTEYYRIMPGAKRVYARNCLEGGFIGGDWDEHTNLTGQLPDDLRTFNSSFIPRYLSQHPDKSKVSAGLAGGMLWTIAKGLRPGDVVLVPDEQNYIHFGRVVGEYEYVPEGPLQHRRKVDWLPFTVHRHELSIEMQNSMGSIGTVSKLSNYAAEIEGLLTGAFISHEPDVAIEDPTAFALEKHLEDFLVANWESTELAKTYRIYEEDGVKVGQQFLTDTGPLDILAVSRDGKQLLVIELKRGRASDQVLGQIQRYMGYVKDELAESGQEVKGIIIALQDDQKLRRALSVAPNIDFYRYQVNFSLEKL